MPRVSVVIPCHNHARYLTRAVNSVASQTFRDWEIIVVDDGSRDDTDRVIDRLAARFRSRVQGISQPHGGVSAARNAGIRLAMSTAAEF